VKLLEHLFTPADLLLNLTFPTFERRSLLQRLNSLCILGQLYESSALMAQSLRVIKVGQKSLIGVFKHFFPGLGFCVDHKNVGQRGFVKEVELVGETREMVR